MPHYQPTSPHISPTCHILDNHATLSAHQPTYQPHMSHIGQPCHIISPPAHISAPHVTYWTTMPHYQPTSPHIGPLAQPFSNSRTSRSSYSLAAGTGSDSASFNWSDSCATR
ncbi:hypothetical protein BgiMline_004441 [Biomphalaria glabrata]|nr:hypothetical protein BgiMline_002555 [Biomphalaria glabrata]